MVAVAAGSVVAQTGFQGLFVDKAGNVGIGTTTPATALDIAGGSLHVAGTAATIRSQGAYLGWNASGSVGETNLINNRGLGSGGFEFANASPAGDTKSLMFISGAGTVGIGTTSPTDMLDVRGSARVAALNITGPVKIDGKNALEFGAGVNGKAPLAGQIGYQILSNGLDIIGGGSDLDRKIMFSAEGGASFNGPLNVVKDITTQGAVDGNMKVVYQIDDQAEKTFQKPIWRYHMTLTAKNYAGRTKTIPKEVLDALCGKPDGCEVRLGMTRWENDGQMDTASIVKQFYYSSVYSGGNRRWRTNDPNPTIGAIGDANRQDAMNAWGTCLFTDATFENGQDRGDRGTGMQLLVWSDYKNPGRTCELTIMP
jgi:hypothetical protein